MLRRNGPVMKSVESVLRLEWSLWGGRFVEEVGLEPGVKERGSYGWWEWELIEWEEVVGEWTGRTETEGLKWGWRRELGSCNGTDLHEIREKTSIDAHALLNLNSRILKIFHSGVILPPKCHFGQIWEVTVWQSCRSRVTFFDFAISLPSVRGRANGVSFRSRLFCSAYYFAAKSL